MSDLPHDDCTRVRLTLRALPDAVPANHRLKRALKCLLRSFGMRCERIEPADAADADTPSATPTLPA
jgi:hypothetical protein